MLSFSALFFFNFIYFRVSFNVHLEHEYYYKNYINNNCYLFNKLHKELNQGRVVHIFQSVRPTNGDPFFNQWNVQRTFHLEVNLPTLGHKKNSSCLLLYFLFSLFSIQNRFESNFNKYFYFLYLFIIHLSCKLKKPFTKSHFFYGTEL